MDLAERLKLAEIKGLGDSPEPETLPELDENWLKTAAKLASNQKRSKNSFEAFVNSQPKSMRGLIFEKSWCCDKCDTFNGVMVGTHKIRKTCSKCARPRGNTVPFVMYYTMED